MAKKFILNNGNLVMSASVAYHFELAKDHSTTKGGGRWHIDDERKILYLWGHSTDFGYAKPEDIKQHVLEGLLSPRLANYTVMHSPLIMDQMPQLETFVELCKVPI